MVVIHIAVCDDTISELGQVCNLLGQYQTDHQDICMQILSFSSSEELLLALDIGQSFDLYLLDILMPDVSGLDIGRHIRRNDERSIIVFLTASEDFALEAFSVSAYQYLIKPLTPQTLFPVLDSALAHLEREVDRRIPIKTREGVFALLHQSIAYVECINHVLYFHMADGSVFSSLHIRTSFEEAVAPLLNDTRFLHPHKSYVLNMERIAQITAQDFVMYGGATVPIARKNYTSVKRVYMRFLSETIKGKHGKTLTEEGNCP